MPFGIGGKREARLIDRAVFADAGNCIHQGFAVRNMHAYVVGGDHRHIGRYVLRQLP